MKRKLRKLIRNPGVFFRDFFIKKYPIINSEQRFNEHDENSVYLIEQYSYNIEENILKNEFDVDVVYTWVNDKDPEWIQKKQKNANYPVTCMSAADQARFEDHNELYYSVLSIKKFMPWVRNIYIITDNQIPAWLVEYNNIFIIDHRDIIDSKYLPTFNSHVIEAHLHKIKGLSENFIYFNDDVMAAKPLNKKHFFRKNNISSLFVSRKRLKDMVLKGYMTPTLYASLNSKEILKKIFNTEIDSPLVHTYVPLKKSIFEEVWANHQSEIEDFLVNKFRSTNDLNMATFLVPWYMYLSQKAVITPEICYYFNIRSNHAITQYRKLLNAKRNKVSPHSFCVNDFNSEKQQLIDYQEQLEAMLKQYFLED